MDRLKICSVRDYFANAVLVKTVLLLRAVTLERTLLQQLISIDLGAQTELVNTGNSLNTLHKCDIRYFNTPHSLRHQIPVNKLFQQFEIWEFSDYSRYKNNFLSTEEFVQCWILTILKDLISRKDIY